MRVLFAAEIMNFDQKLKTYDRVDGGRIGYFATVLKGESRLKIMMEAVHNEEGFISLSEFNSSPVVRNSIKHLDRIA